MNGYSQLTAKMISVFAFALGGLLTIACAQTPAPRTVEQIRELNRAGQWQQAAEMAENFLASGAARSGKEKCQTYASLIYAQKRLGRLKEAEAARAASDELCRDGALPKDVSLKMSPPGTAADSFWQTGEPAALRVNPAVLDEHRQLCERTGADACVVVRGGKIVQELYSERYRLPMFAMSSTKSVTGILAGMLVDDGKIKSLDESVCGYLKEWCAGEKARVTLRDLLAMTSGLPRKYEDGVGGFGVGDKNSFVIGEPLAFEPGKSWNYSNEGVQLLSPILDRAAGEPIQDYARRRLFEPLGMKETRLRLDAAGHAWTYADMETSARDFARLGLLMLNKGVWQGRRIVSREWVERSTRPSQALNPGYGLLWWLYETPRGYGAQGYLDTNLYVFPELDLVVVRMQSKPIQDQPSYEAEALKLFDRMVQK